MKKIAHRIYFVESFHVKFNVEANSLSYAQGYFNVKRNLQAKLNIQTFIINQ